MSIVLNGTTGITTPDIDSAAAPDLDASNFTNLPVSPPLFGTAETLTGNTTLTSADDKKAFNCTAAVTITLPAPTEGLVFGLVASASGNLSLKAASSSTLVGDYTGSALIEAQSSAIVVGTGTKWNIIGGSGKITLKVVQFAESGTYTPNGPVAILACCTGASASSGHGHYWNHPGTGGGGYSEKFITSLASSYSVVVGAGGQTNVNSGGAVGGTTTFDTISIPSSPEAGSNSTIGGLGGVGSGGSYNATGGNGSSITDGANQGSAGGGAATRAGDGGDAGTNSSSGSGGSGGTGGNAGGDGAGSGGAAATSEASGVTGLTLLSNPVFEAGGSAITNGSTGNYGAGCLTVYTDTVSGDTFEIGKSGSGGGAAAYRQAYSSGRAGRNGHVTIVEFYA